MTWARPTRSVWRAMAIALWVAAIATVAAAVWLPYDVPDAPAAAADVPSTRPATAPAAVTFDDVLDLNLRRPLVDPPTTGPAAAVALVPTGPDVRLAGIVAEPGHSFAVFVTPSGSTEVRAVGQRAGGTEVLAISPAAVTVRFDGRTTTLRLAASRSQ
jgi:hypothetical protein